MVRDNIISFEQNAGSARRRISSAKTAEIVAACRVTLVDTLPRLMRDLFERLDDELYALADKSHNDVLQTSYFETMRELRKLRDPIEQAYLRTQLAAYDDFWQDGRRSGAQRNADSTLLDDDLELVDNDELEENLAIGSMVSKADNRFHRELFALNMRFAQLAGLSEVADADNPVAPASIVDGFQRALALWRGDLAVRLVIYKLFDRHVMSYIGGIYDELNDKLVAAEVLPKIVQRVRRNPVAPSVEKARNPDHGGPAAPSGPGAAADQGGPVGGESASGAGGLHSEVLSVLGNLLALNRQSGRAGPYGNSVAGYANVNLPEISSRDLVGALSSIQQQQTVADFVPSVNEVQQFQGEVLNSLGRELEMGALDQPSKRFARGDQDIIDVMGMLFEFILDDRNVPDAMKALLGRLQIPMLKVAVIDRRFFSNPAHPARRLLNSLARAAMTWVDDGDRSEQSLYGRIEAIVNRVLVEFVDDVDLFDTIATEFSAYQERETRSAEVAEERISQVSRGQEQLQLARKTVADVLDGYMGKGELPEAVKRLLSEGWRDVMLLAYLREGGESQAWKQSCDMVERLIWSVQPKRAQDERQALLKSIPEMLKELRDSLVNISFDQHRAATLFKELQTCHIAALRGDTCATPATTTTASVRLTESEEQPVASAEVPSTSSKPEDSDECYQMAACLGIGQWFEWDKDGGEPVRAKLSWRSEVSGNCIFVSRKGMKVAEMSVCDIAEYLRAGRGRVIADVNTPFMDKALNAMLKVLGDGAKGAPQAT